MKKFIMHVHVPFAGVLCLSSLLPFGNTNAGLSFVISFVFFPFQPFATVPYVFATAVHPVTNKHDAASVWAEDATRYNFRACLRELKNFDGVHQYLSVVSSELRSTFGRTS